MVTNRKIQNDNDTSNSRASLDAYLHDTFVGVLRRRSAADADAAALRAERLAKWDALGRELEANGWHNLETALEAARDAVCKQRPGDLHEDQRIGAEEAEQLSARFADDCRRIIVAGGAMALWHIVVADLTIPHAVINDFVEGRQESDPIAEPQVEMLVDSARCYALAAIAGVTAPSYWKDLRSLFGPNCVDTDVEAFAPFAVDNDSENYSWRVRQAACEFAAATTNAHRIEATEAYAYSYEMAGTSYTLAPVQRLGLIAWLARRGIKGELRSCRAPRGVPSSRAVR